ncbi:MAG: hypothetical protein GDA51_08710 [Ekhidna sp.]|nr:hypothetical protein [Ekhidna sp.]
MIRQSGEGFYALLSWSFKPPRFSKPWRFLMIMLFDKKSPQTPARAL